MRIFYVDSNGKVCKIAEQEHDGPSSPPPIINHPWGPGLGVIGAAVGGILALAVSLGQFAYKPNPVLPVVPFMPDFKLDDEQLEQLLRHDASDRAQALASEYRIALQDQGPNGDARVRTILEQMLQRIAAEGVSRLEGNSRAALDLYWPGPDAWFLGHVLNKPYRKSISHLGDTLVAKDSMLRVGAIVVLQVRGLRSKEEILAVSENLRDSAVEVRRASAIFLQRIGLDLEETTASLRVGLRDPDPIVSRQCAAALLVRRPRDSAARHLLVSELGSSDPTVRAEAAYRLCQTVDEHDEAVQDLTPLLEDPRLATRAAAALVLIAKGHGDGRAWRILAASMESKPGIRKATALFLWAASTAIGNRPDLSKEISKAVEANDDAVRAEAEWSRLWIYSKPEPEDRLRHKLKGPDAKLRVRTALFVLAGDNKTVPFSWSERISPELVHEAQSTLANENLETQHAVELLRAALHYEIGAARVRAAHLLGLMGKSARAAVPDLIELGKDPLSQVRKAAVWALNEIKPPAHGPNR